MPTLSDRDGKTLRFARAELRCVLRAIALPDLAKHVHLEVVDGAAPGPLPELQADAFAIVPEAGECRILSQCTRGVVYGTYALLEGLGCRWHFPGAEAECLPCRPGRLPERMVLESPDTPYRSLVLSWDRTRPGRRERNPGAPGLRAARALDACRGITYDTTVKRYQVVVDTNVLVAALRSRLGASHKLLSLLGSSKFEIALSVPVALEYEDAAKRLIGESPLSEQDIDATIDYLCSVAHLREVYFLWRPFLRDSKDDMILELAVTAQCDYIITYNVKDYQGIDSLGMKTITPRGFLKLIGELP